MADCTPQNALSFLAQVKHLINCPLTHSHQTLLMLAASLSSLSLVKATLAYQPQVHMTDSAGRTALHYAAAVGSIDIFQALESAGCLANAQTIGGETPLAKACTFGQGDIIEWYLNNSPDSFQIVDKTGRKPLDYLRTSGQALYEEVAAVYSQIHEDNTMKQE